MPELEVPEWARAKVRELEAKKPKFGVALCSWDQQPFIRLRPWARFCSDTCRIAEWMACHPRVVDVKRGRRLKAEKLLSRAR